jgi:peptidoglycan/LPS O-acetylase OafA/YrhL
MSSTRHYISGLDGLRALAVLAVIIYHLFPSALPGGFLGVDIFFVISGFLITSLLITEHARNLKIRLKEFWLRRARRLLPALCIVILVISSVAFFIRGDILVGIGQQILGASTFSSNWVEVLVGTNYFSNNGTHLFMNFWSLAVEEQFYLIWPLMVLFLVAVVKKPWISAIITLLLAAGSAGWMAYLFARGISTTRLYYGTDTHVFGLMIGASLAFLARTQNIAQPLRRLSQPFSKLRRVPVLTQIIGFLSLAGLVALFFTLPDQSPLTYSGGLALASLLTALVIVATVSMPQPLQQLFELSPLKWIGTRSYGIYLWHWPVLVLLRYLLPHILPWWIAPLSLFVVTFAVSDLSYRFIEMPVRKNGFRKTFQRAIKRKNVQLDHATMRIHARPHTAALAICLALILTIGAVVSAPTRTSAQLRIEKGQAAIRQIAKHPPKATPVKQHVPITGNDISAVGDSVMLASAPYLQQTFPGIIIDAEVSRSMRRGGLETLENMKTAGTLRKTVVVALGTNGYYGTGMFDQMITELKDYNIVLVTAHGDREWTAPNNDDVRRAANTYKNVSIAEWDTAITPHPDFLAEDGIHPITADGDKIYGDCIAAALKKFE